MPTPRIPSGSRVRRPLALQDWVTEIFTLCSLAIAGLVLRVTLMLIPPALLGAAREPLLAVGPYFSWILVAGFVVWRTRQAVDERRAARRAKAFESMSPLQQRNHSVARRRAARARRRAQGVSTQVLTREDFLTQLAEELAVPGTPLSMLLARIDAESDVDRAQARSEVAAACLSLARENDMVGHLGDGLFALALPESAPRVARRRHQEMIELLLTIGADVGGRVHESMTSPALDEELESFYRRAVDGLRRIERSATGRVLRVA